MVLVAVPLKTYSLRVSISGGKDLISSFEQSLKANPPISVRLFDSVRYQALAFIKAAMLFLSWESASKTTSFKEEYLRTLDCLSPQPGMAIFHRLIVF